MGRYERLETIIKERKLSKGQFAMSCGILPCNFYQGLNGRCPFYEGWKVRVAEVLNMEISEIFGTEGE